MAGFGKSDPIVRIRCRPEALLRAGLKRQGSLFVGAVRYKREQELLALAGTANEGSDEEVLQLAASMLVHKRQAFRFEKELRLLCLNTQPEQDCIFLNIDPLATIRQVMISPYALPDQRRDIEGHCRNLGIKPKISAVLKAPPYP
jgi:hypothetical protein